MTIRYKVICDIQEAVPGGTRRGQYRGGYARLSLVQNLIYLGFQRKEGRREQYFPSVVWLFWPF